MSTTRTTTMHHQSRWNHFVVFLGVFDKKVQPFEWDFSLRIWYVWINNFDFYRWLLMTSINANEFDQDWWCAHYSDEHEGDHSWKE
jgi:hypothetical protein